MDKIRAEIERKKQLLAKVSSHLEPSQKFITQKDLQTVAENEKIASLQLLEEERENRKRKSDFLAANANTNHSHHNNNHSNNNSNNNSINKNSSHGTVSSSFSSASAATVEAENNSNSLSENVSLLSLHEIQQRLRRFMQPITLFGESNEERLSRLTTVLLNQQHMEQEDDFRSRRNELIDDNGDDDGSADSDSDSDDDGDDNNDGNEDKKKKKKSGAGNNNPAERVAHEKPNDAKPKRINFDRATGKSQFSSDPSLSKEKVIVKYFKFILKMWEWDLNDRDDAAKLTMKGKNETKTQKQCKDYIRPLFKLCKKKLLNPDIKAPIFEMVKCCEEGDFMKANDHYLRCAIGNSAWPIGLTMVGIHERSGRERISSSKVAHIMNNELQRKYLSSVKRLMTFAQTKRPDVPPSKKLLV